MDIRYRVTRIDGYDNIYGREITGEEDECEEFLGHREELGDDLVKETSVIIFHNWMPKWKEW